MLKTITPYLMAFVVGLLTATVAIFTSCAYWLNGGGAGL